MYRPKADASRPPALFFPPFPDLTTVGLVDDNPGQSLRGVEDVQNSEQSIALGDLMIEMMASFA
jgi:hypothetical protein